MDGIVFCYEAGRTSRHALLRAKGQLESIGKPILGVILNHIDPGTQRLQSYSYHYYRKYDREKADQS
jgi:Mrp family chromosome partitioning ATPase